MRTGLKHRESERRREQLRPKSCRVQEEEESSGLHVSVASLRLTCLTSCFVSFRTHVTLS